MILCLTCSFPTFTNHLCLCLSADRLDDVELAGVGAGGGRLCGFVRRLATGALGQPAVEPDGPAGVS